MNPNPSDVTPTLTILLFKANENSKKQREALKVQRPVPHFSASHHSTK